MFDFVFIKEQATELMGNVRRAEHVPVFDTTREANAMHIVQFWGNYKPSLLPFLASCDAFFKEFTAQKWGAMFKDALAGRVDSPKHQAWADVERLTGQQGRVVLPFSVACLPANTARHREVVSCLEQQSEQYARLVQQQITTASVLGKIKEMGILEALAKKHKIICKGCSTVKLLMFASTHGSKGYAIEHTEIIKAMGQLRYAMGDLKAMMTSASENAGIDGRSSLKKTWQEFEVCVEEGMNWILEVDEILMDRWMEPIYPVLNDLSKHINKFTGLECYEDFFVKSPVVSKIKHLLGDQATLGRDIEAFASVVGAVEDNLKPIRVYVDEGITCNNRCGPDELTPSRWLEEQDDLLSHGKLMVTLLSAWEIMCDDQFQQATPRERKTEADILKPDLTRSCSSSHPFPAQMVLLMDAWVSTGTAELSVQHVSGK